MEMGMVEAVTENGDAMRLSAHLDADWSLLLLKLGGRAAVARWLGSRSGWWTPGNETGRGLGHTLVVTEQSGAPGWDQNGSASPYWLAVNKICPTPCKHASSELLPSELVAVRPSPVGPRQPWRPSATQQFDPSPLDSRRCAPPPLAPLPPSAPKTPRGPRQPSNQARPPRQPNGGSSPPQYLKRSSLVLPTPSF